MTVVETPGNPKSRKVVLTDSNDGFAPRLELRRASKNGEIVVDQPYYAIKRVNPRDVAKKGVTLEGPVYFLAVPESAPNPPMPNPSNDAVITYASNAAQKKGYKVISRYDPVTENLTHAEVRGRQYAQQHGLIVVGQAPTIPVCDKCRNSIGAQGLAVFPPSAL